VIKGPCHRINASIGHSFDIYDNGTLSTVGWDDTGGDLDHNDKVMEVAVVYRRSYFDWLEPVVAAEADVARFPPQRPAEVPVIGPDTT
jgi:hypothetical protein